MAWAIDNLQSSSIVPKWPFSPAGDLPAYSCSAATTTTTTRQYQETGYVSANVIS